MSMYLCVAFIYNLVASVAPDRQILSVVVNNHLRDLQELEKL